MDKLKIIEMILLAVSALLSAAKYVVKFIDYIRKLNKKTSEYG